jgi:hypothetical protein
MNKIIATTALLLVASCGNGVRLAPVDYADAGTTGLAVASSTLIEGNPVIASAGPAAPIAALAIKIGVKQVFVAGGMEVERANRLVETGSAFGFCNNTALLLGANTGVGLALGAICAFAYLNDA